MGRSKIPIFTYPTSKFYDYNVYYVLLRTHDLFGEDMYETTLGKGTFLGYFDWVCDRRLSSDKEKERVVTEGTRTRFCLKEKRRYIPLTRTKDRTH